MIESDVPLSLQGAKRREAILRQALDAARARRRRRWEARGLILVVLGVGAFLAIRNEQKTPLKEQVTVIPVPVEPHENTIQIEWLRSDPAVLDRLAPQPSPPQWTSIGDDELLDAMAAAGQPSGMIRVGDETILMPHRSDPGKEPGT